MGWFRDGRPAGWCSLGAAPLAGAAAALLLLACNALTGVGDLTAATCDECEPDVPDGGGDGGLDVVTGGRDGATTRDGATEDARVEGAGGFLDLSFGTGGTLETDLLPDPHAVAVRADGRIVVVGAMQNDLAAVAFTSSGAIDTSFGNNGRVVRGMGSSSFGNAVAFDSMGRALVGGTSVVVTTVVTRFAYVVRIGGSQVDASFGTNGAWRGSVAGQEARGLVTTPGDGVVLSAADKGDHAFWRLTAMGEPDGAFGNGGQASLANVGGEPAGLVALADGFVSGGTADGPGAEPALAAAKVSLLGKPASAFGAAGLATIKVGLNSAALGKAIAAQSDGKLVVAGDYEPVLNTSRRVSVVSRLSSAGQVDLAYGGGGRVAIDFMEAATGRETETSSNAVLVDAAGRALAVGAVVDKLLAGGQRGRAWVVRLRDDGSFDPLFGSQGKLLIGTAPARLEVRGAALQPDGKLVLVGVNLDTNKLFLSRVVTSTFQ